MKRRVAFMFAGQGCQYYQMGRELYERHPVFRECMDRMDRAALTHLGESVLATLYGPCGKGQPFDNILLTHPAIFMVEFSLATTLMEAGIRPDLTLGSSLGTMAAVAVAGGLPTDEALAMIVRQAQLIERQCPRGAMIAVLGDPRLYEASPFLQARATIAGRNFASHFVLSTPHENREAVEAFLARAGAVHQRLPVPFPFHAHWIEPIREALIEACPGTRVRPLAMPVVCCATGMALASTAEDYFWRVARQEMVLMEAVASIEAEGPVDYVDLTPSATMAGFLKQLLAEGSASRAWSAMSPFGRDVEVLDALTTRLRAELSSCVQA